MGIIIFGSKEATIGVDELMVRCPSCEAHNFADVMVVSKYFHVYYIPIFPYAKEATIICQKCGLRRYNLPFEKRLFSDFDEIKKRFKHPWYTYSFIVLVTILVIGGFVLN